MPLSALMPMPWWTPVDEVGRPYPGGKAYFYQSGTTIPQPVYVNPEATIPHPFPLILDGDGRAVVFMGPTHYRVVLYDRNDVLVGEQEYVESSAALASTIDILVVAGEQIDPKNVVYLSYGGGGTIAGRWYRASGTTYATASVPMVGIGMQQFFAGETGMIRLAGTVHGFAGLVTGSVVYIAAGPPSGQVTSVAPAFPRIIGYASDPNTVLLHPVPVMHSWVDVSGTLAVAGLATFSSTINGQTIGAATALTGTLVVTGRTALNGGYTVGGMGNFNLAAGVNNDLAIPSTGAFFVPVAAGGGSTITGMANGAEGRVVMICNVGSAISVTLTEEGATSFATNRFGLGGAPSLVLVSGASAQFLYTSSRWRKIG